MMDAAELNAEPVIQPPRPERALSTGTGLAHRWALGLVLGLTFLAYSGTLRFEFVYDDIHQISENPAVQSWHYAPGYFARSVWYHQDGHAPGNYYRPIFLLWLLINFMSFGLEPSLWHLTTIFMHVLATLMLYHLANRVVKDRWIASVAALIFGLHPVHIEATAWVSGVTESLLAVMFIPSLLCFIRSREPAPTALVGGESPPAPRRRVFGWLAASLLLYALALLSKETAIVMPMVVFAYVLIFGNQARGSQGTIIAEGNGSAPVMVSIARRVTFALKPATPFLAVTVLYLIARALVLKAILHPPKSGSVSLIQTALTAPSIVLFYIKQLVWPVGLSGFYDLDLVSSPWSSAFWIPLSALVLIAVALYWAIRRSSDAGDRNIAWFAVALVLLPILPVLNLSAFRAGELVHDRYLYLPSLGLSLLVALALCRINVRCSKLFGLPSYQVISVMALAGALGFATAYQHAYWSNDLVLYRHGLSVAPNSSVAKNNLANLYSKNGLYESAIVLFQQLAENEPNFWEPIYNLGYNYQKLGKYEEAEKWLRRGLEINKTNADQFLTLGVVLFETNRLDEAEAALRYGIELKANGLGLHYALGAVLRTKGNLLAALDEFKTELAYNPQYLAASEQIAQIEEHFNAVSDSRAK
jgi:protein O-mannosyl-transferase